MLQHLQAQSFFGLYLHPIIWLMFLAFFGLVLGSLLNVVIYRLPLILLSQWRSEATDFLKNYDTNHTTTKSAEATQTKIFNLALPASHCPQCQHPIAWYHNIPLFSYVWLKGRCHSCREPIPFIYPFVELLTAILFMLLGVIFGATSSLFFSLILLCMLIAISFIDSRYQMIPDELTLPTLWLGLLVNTQALFCPLRDAVFGAIVGYLFLWFVYQSFKLLTKKEGMGYGDFKLLAMLGAWIGWQPLPFVLLIASAVGLLVGGYRILRGHQQHNQPIPFGPFLAFGGFVMLLWQQIG